MVTEAACNPYSKYFRSVIFVGRWKTQHVRESGQLCENSLFFHTVKHSS